MISNANETMSTQSLCDDNGNDCFVDNDVHLPMSAKADELESQQDIHQNRNFMESREGQKAVKELHRRTLSIGLHRMLECTAALKLKCGDKLGSEECPFYTHDPQDRRKPQCFGDARQSRDGYWSVKPSKLGSQMKNCVNTKEIMETMRQESDRHAQVPDSDHSFADYEQKLQFANRRREVEATSPAPSTTLRQSDHMEEEESVIVL